MARRAGPSHNLILVLAALVGALVLGGCTYRDPGYTAEAANESDTAVVIRDRTTKWTLPPHSAGYLFAVVGDIEEADPITYEVLDAQTCLVIGEATVEFWPERRSTIVIGGDLRAEVELYGRRRIIQPAEKVDQCPGQADGWSLWVQNRTETVYYVRSRTPGGDSSVAFVSPRSSKLAIRGNTETSTVELLDRQCNVLSTYERQGFDHFRGTIDDGRMVVVPEVLAVLNPPSFGSINQCRVWEKPPPPEPVGPDG